MPANRSRTERWREGLKQISDRGGALEFSLAQEDGTLEADRVPDLVWRVKLLAVGEDELLVEMPQTMGRTIPVAPGTALVGVMIIGQNRWMFGTNVMDSKDGPSPWARHQVGMRVRMPETVERCVRREFQRVSTMELKLPRVECWPLLEPSSVIPAEAANRAAINDFASHRFGAPAENTFTLPEVGPKFQATLLNIGGGGVGLLLDRGDSNALDRTRLLWLRVDLRPIIPAPMGFTAKVAHTHFDSAQNVYAGISFEFAFNPQHKIFIIEQVERYVAALLMRKKAAA